MSGNAYPWNHVQGMTTDNATATVLHFGLHAVCEHLARIEAALAPPAPLLAEEGEDLAAVVDRQADQIAHLTRLVASLIRVEQAWVEQGPSPLHHERAKALLRSTWPSLANAIDDAAATLATGLRSGA